MNRTSVLCLFQELYQSRDCYYLIAAITSGIFGGMLLPAMYCALGLLCNNVYGSNDTRTSSVLVSIVTLLGVLMIFLTEIQVFCFYAQRRL